MKKIAINMMCFSKTALLIFLSALAVSLSGCGGGQDEDFSNGFPVCYRGGNQCVKFKFVDTSNLTYSYNSNWKSVSASYFFYEWEAKGLEKGRVGGLIEYMDGRGIDKGFGYLYSRANEVSSMIHLARGEANGIHFDLYKDRSGLLEGFFINKYGNPFAMVSCMSPFNGRMVCVVRSTVSENISFDGRFVWTNDALSAMKFFGENFSKITNSIVEVK